MECAATDPLPPFQFPVWVDLEHIHHFGDRMHPEHPGRVERILMELHHVFGNKIDLHANADPLPEDILAACTKKTSWRPTTDGDTYETAATELLLERGRAMLDAAVDTLIEGSPRHNNCGFVLIRPPGHHAGPDDIPTGFCHQNNVWHAALRFAEAGYENITIFDWDVHHGDGTEAIWRSSPPLSPIRFCSMHAFGPGIYPGTGEAFESRGLLNVPVAKGTGGRSYYKLFREKVLPFLESADVILISAGYDAHADDPMGYLRLDEETYYAMSRDVKGLGCPVLFVLEGGYNPDALARSVVATMRPWLRVL
jgi:acetoin utilization deacetylase AcuC-like enzyme